MDRLLPRPRQVLPWLFTAAVLSLLAAAPPAVAQSPSCSIAYTWPQWTGGNGFGAEIRITNTGPAITNGWTLVFNMPNGQRVTQGWPVSFTHPAGSPTVTVASNAQWNQSIATNGTFTVGFNGTFSGANNPPAAFTLNGTSCTTPGGNTPPVVTLTAPTAGQVFPSGTTSVTLSANATDNVSVQRVEFRLNGALVNTDTAAGYSYTATGLTAGTYSWSATAFDAGSPALSSVASGSFTIQGGGGNTAPVVSFTAPINNQVFPAGTTSVQLSANATDNVSVQRVEFRVNGTLVNTDMSAPYQYTHGGLTAGNYTATATAYDAGSPVLSTVATVAFSIGASTPVISFVPNTLSINAGGTGTSSLRLSAAPSGSTTVPVTITRSGSTVITSTPTSVTFNSSNWQGVNVTFTAATGTTTATSTFTAAASGYTSGSITVNRTVTTSGNALFRVGANGRITKNGQHFPVRCGSWFGLEGRHEPSDDPTNPSGAAMEQYIGNTSWANGGQGTGRTIAQTMSEIAGMGINVIRLPLVPQTLNANDPQGTGSVLKNHSSVRIANSRLALETMIRAADAANIEVMLDVHSCSNYVGWRAGRLDARPPWVDHDRDNYDFKRENYSCAASGNPSTVTTTHPYNTTMWLNDLRTLAGLSASLGVDNIIGIDIFNEPHDYTWAEWKSLTEQAYAAINAVNPNLLLFVQGIGTNASTQDGTPTTINVQPHGSLDTNPNWGENLFEAVSNPINVPKAQLVFSPHTYGPSVFVQKMFMDPAQSQCTGLEGDAAGDANCNIVINPTLLRQGWEEHFGFLKQQGFAIVVGEFGGNMDWPLGQASIRDRDRWSHITPGIDQQWQNAFVSYMAEKDIEGCYWSINPESGDTAGWYGHAYDPISNESGWGEWRPFDQRKTNLLNTLWQGVP
jgi:endoglucanase